MAEDWESWGESDYEAEIAKLQAEAEDRLDKKIKELMSNLEEK